MKIYNRGTNELFNRFNFEKPTLFKHIKSTVKIYFQSYWYMFPQIICSWTGVKGHKIATHFCWLFIRIIFTHKR